MTTRKKATYKKKRAGDRSRHGAQGGGEKLFLLLTGWLALAVSSSLRFLAWIASFLLHSGSAPSSRD